MIPKIIHYVWIGGNPLNELAEKCIASWKKYCPDYEIKRWDETNLDVNQNRYCKEAYEAKKWAFVSDFFRFQILYNEGGIYLDTDVELLRPLDDLLNNKCFMGFDDPNSVNPGSIIGSEKGHPFLNEMLEFYNHANFNIGETVCVNTTRTLLKYGLNFNNQNQNLTNDVKVYSTEYFCPLKYGEREPVITNNTYSIHWYAATWVTKPNFWQRIINKIKNLIKKIIGPKNVKKIQERRWQKKIEKENETKNN